MPVAERSSLWVTADIDQEEARVGTGALLVPGTSAVKAKSGFRPGPGTSPGLVQASGTPDANVSVAPFQAFLQTSRASVGGPYSLTLDSSKTINILSTPADATNPRDDLIIAYQADTFYGDGSSAMAITQVVGTPSGTPSDPSTAAYPDHLKLARVRVDAGATTITSAKITDLRSSSLSGGMWTVGLGGILPVASQTERDALSKWDGLTVWRMDRDWVEICDGLVFRVVGVPIVTSTADLSAITSPYTGQIASNTGDGMLYRYNGTAWRVRGLYRVTTTLAASASAITFSSIPTYLRRLSIAYTARSTHAVVSTGLGMRINNDSTASRHLHSVQQLTGTTTSGAVNSPATTYALIGTIPAASAAANVFGGGVVDIPGWNVGSHYLNWVYQSHFYENSAATVLNHGGGMYAQAVSFTRIDILPENGQLAAGTEITLTGWE
jgi:hypothetical protein